MGEAGEDLKLVKRGGTHVLVEEVKKEEDQPRTKSHAGKSSDESKVPVLLRHPKLLALMTVLGAGISSSLLPNNVNPFNAEGAEPDLRTVAEVENISDQNLLEFPKPFEEAFGNLLPGEKEEAFSGLRSHMDSLSLSNEQITDIAGYEPMIRETAKAIGIPEDLFLGLVITESKGNSRAVSSAGAKGLTQMMVPIAEKYGLATTDIDEEDPTDTDERLNPEKILGASAEELMSYYHKFGDWSLAFWAWHAGEPAVYRAVQIYADSPSGGGIRLPDINPEADFMDSLAITGYYQNYIKEKNINTFRLFQNEHVQEYFADTPNSDWDQTRIYVELNTEWAMQWNELKASGLNLTPSSD